MQRQSSAPGHTEGAPPRLLRTMTAGVHINGYVETPRGLELWVARRSQTKATWPGKLDHIVAGGQPAGMTCSANVVKARPCWSPLALASGVLTVLSEPCVRRLVFVRAALVCSS